MRPGEKLYEELFFTDANVTPTVHPKVLRAHDAELAVHRPQDIDALIQAAQESRSETTLRKLILKLVPEFAWSAEGTQRGAFAAPPVAERAYCTNSEPSALSSDDGKELDECPVQAPANARSGLDRPGFARERMR
jgi:hypothetical protein